MSWALILSMTASKGIKRARQKPQEINTYYDIDKTTISNINCLIDLLHLRLASGDRPRIARSDNLSQDTFIFSRAFFRHYTYHSQNEEPQKWYHNNSYMLDVTL